MAFVERAPQPVITRLGQNIARLRNQAGLTQLQLAEKADVSIRQLQKMEAGIYGGSLAIHLKLRKALKCDWNTLFERMR